MLFGSSSFNPRTPCGVRLIVPPNYLSFYRFQSTHSLRSATISPVILSASLAVSIHALLAECDRCRSRSKFRQDGFNPRTPCGVRRQSAIRQYGWIVGFNPRTPCGVRRVAFRKNSVPLSEVSIHALLAECDREAPAHPSSADQFQSTHSLRSATDYVDNASVGGAVSIHALLAECDLSPSTGKQGLLPFQSTHSLRSATFLRR